MRAGRGTIVASMLWMSSACAGEEPQSRMGPAQSAGMTAPPPAADAGSRPEDLLPDLPDARTEVVTLPDDDGGVLPLPSSQAMKPPADPSITFDWPETDPGSAACEPGEYTGTFSCLFTLNDAFAQMFGFMVELSGPVTLTLERSMNGEFLEIADGQFDAVAESVIGARAALQGRLDCRTRVFQATLAEGLWALGDPSMPLFPGGTLDGDITGTYEAGMLSGLWSIGDPMLGYCKGTWNASLTP